MRKLSPEQLLKGGILCLKNASNLIEEADLLFQNKKFNRAYFLYYTSGEEIAKGEDIMWYAHDINIGLSRNFFGLDESFRTHIRKSKTNFVTLTMFNTKNIQRMKKMSEILVKVNSLKEAKIEIEKYLSKFKNNNLENRIDKFYNKRMKMRNDCLYVNYKDKSSFFLKSIKKKQVLAMKKEVSYLLDTLKNSILVAKDKKWRKKGKEVQAFIKGNLENN